jgi:ABC-type uncharacterized transport system ATPase subunit
MTPIIEVQGITKRFPGVLANDEIDFALQKGEVHALLGENGAGKSTLMNVIYGLYQPDGGRVLINGQQVEFDSPDDAIKAGIGMVHQHFMLVPVMTVTENIMLGVEETTGSRYIGLGAAALLGATLGGLMNGWAGLIFWLAAVALYLLLTVLPLRLRMGNLLFGAITGLIFGAIYNVVIGVLTDTAAVTLWPFFGTVIGAVANLRWMNKQLVASRVRQLSQDYGLEVDPNAYIQDLSVGTQQRVEIIKALYRKAKVLILDEPTAVLTPQEADDLFKVMRQLTEQGVSIVFITHKLREVLAAADRITVLRRGKVVGITTPAQATRESLARMMVGREVLLQVEKEEARPQDVVLEVHQLQVEDDRRHLAVNKVSFQVRAGEIVGVAGVQGNGQTELVAALTGLRSIRDGRVLMLDQDVTGQRPRVITGLGTAHIPEDRQKHGLVMTYPVADNLILADYYDAPFSKGVVLDEPHIEENAQRLVEEFDIRTPSVFTLTNKLSGGNQQKVIVARELARHPRLLVANQPTRGLDVGSIEFIHTQIVKARDSGAGVLLVSAELDEIMSLSDRIVVMYQGEIMADIPAIQATREKLGLLMAGVQVEGLSEPVGKIGA